MTDWIDFCVYAAFIIALWFVGPRATPVNNLRALADRNPAWAAACPEAARSYNGSRWFIASCYLIGTLWLGALLAFQLGWFPAPAEPPAPERETAGWQVLWGIAMASMVLALIYGGAGGLTFWMRCLRKVPLVERRHATLEPRSIGDFVPLWAQLATYALVLANIAAWLGVGALGLYSTPMFWSRVLITLFLSAFFFVAAHGAVVRRPNAADRTRGPAHRRVEVRVAFAVQLLTPLVGAVRLYEELTNTIVFDVNRALGLGLVALVMVMLLRSYADVRPPKLPPARSSGENTAGELELAEKM